MEKNKKINPDSIKPTVLHLNQLRKDCQTLLLEVRQCYECKTHFIQTFQLFNFPDLKSYDEYCYTFLDSFLCDDCLSK